MLTKSLIVARKEIVDHARDRRALMSSGLYAIMGPAVTALVVAAARGHAASASPSPVLVAMASAFAVMAAFTGALTLTMDTIAGERERRSLLPLCMNPVTWLEIMVGKWLAAMLFAAVAVAVNVIAFAMVLAGTASLARIVNVTILTAIVAMLPLVALAAAGELLVATICRTVKEANSYLSMLTFIVMGAIMWLAVRPDAGARWWLLPIAGHERLLERAFGNAWLSPGAVGLLSAITVIAAWPVILTAARRLAHDAAVYGD